MPPRQSSFGFGERMFIGMQYLLPQHGLSRLVLRATRMKSARIKNFLILNFLKMYRVNMGEAEIGEPTAYPTFNAFFTRALRTGVRRIDPAADAIVSPVDGTVSEAGQIDGDRLLQAKGRRYGVAELLADDALAQRFRDGEFATIYLAPFNYHRIHMPIDGRLVSTLYVPGRLFSVNSSTARYVPRLFARNERVVTLFETPVGGMALVMVGALNVGSMATVWAGDITPAPRRRVTRLSSAPVALSKGVEMGRFNMGSTVILLFERHRVRLHPDLAAGRSVQLGERIADGVHSDTTAS